MISTSEFHKTRAEKIFKGVIPEINPVWNLSNSYCSQCWNDEKIHMKNIVNDVQRAINNIM